MEPHDSRELVLNAAKGAAVGFAASTVMGMCMEVARASEAFAPPQRKLLSLVGIRMQRPRLTASTTALHLCYGGVVGALSGPLLQQLPTQRARIIGGVAVAGAVWAVTYAGSNPSVGWMERPTSDLPRARPWVTFCAHLLFGALLGALRSPVDSPEERNA